MVVAPSRTRLNSEGAFSFSVSHKQLNIRQLDNISRRMSDSEGTPRPPVQTICIKRQKVHSGSAHPKAALAGCFAMTYLSIMVPLLSLSLTQREQLGEILGGVKVPECVAKRSLADRPLPGKLCQIRAKL